MPVVIVFVLGIIPQAQNVAQKSDMQGCNVLPEYAHAMWHTVAGTTTDRQGQQQLACLHLEGLLAALA
jgi:ubiquinone biosynthesis protein Coq4